MDELASYRVRIEKEAGSKLADEWVTDTAHCLVDLQTWLPIGMPWSSRYGKFLEVWDFPLRDWIPDPI